MDHNFHIYNIVNEFKSILVDTNHKFQTHYITYDFKFVIVEKDDNFHIYDILDELSICMWKEITNSYSPFIFSNNDPFEGEHEHHKEV